MALLLLLLVDNQWYLTSSINGDFILDYNGDRIDVQFEDEANIDYYDISDRIGVFAFDNPYGLDSAGDNRYLQTERSGEAADYGLDKLNYALERSNVDISEEMVNLIQTQRAIR